MNKALLLAASLLTINSAQASSILVSDSGGELDYGYGYSRWDNMTAALNTASGNGVQVVANYNNLAQVLSADALFLDQRWLGGSLSATEVNNISAFIATGKRVVMMGENVSWNTWNNQILGIVGGTSGGEFLGTTPTVLAHPLTAGVGSVSLQYSGVVTSGGTPLFEVNWATLWGAQQNVLTLLDVNVMEDDFWEIQGNAEFSLNVADWISAVPVVPEPSTGALLMTMVGVQVIRRLRARKELCHSPLSR